MNKVSLENFAVCDMQPKGKMMSLLGNSSVKVNSHGPTYKYIAAPKSLLSPQNSGNTALLCMYRVGIEGVFWGGGK